MRTPELIPVDLRKRDDCQHPDIKAGKHYLAKIGRQYYAGTFSKQWYGWNFNAVYDAGIQLDDSDWKALWEIV